MYVDITLRYIHVVLHSPPLFYFLACKLLYYCRNTCSGQREVISGCDILVVSGGCVLGLA